MNLTRTAALSLLLVLEGGQLVQAQAGAGAAYGARNPTICDNTKSKGAAPTVEEATRFFRCTNESESARWGLVLIEDVKLEMAGPRKYNPGNDLNVPQINVTAPIYDLRGKFTRYSCDKVGGPGTGLSPAGKNCNKFPYLHATGTCYKTTFGEWKCQMMDLTVKNDGDIEIRGVAPPK